MQQLVDSVDRRPEALCTIRAFLRTEVKRDVIEPEVRETSLCRSAVAAQPFPIQARILNHSYAFGHDCDDVVTFV